MPTYTTTLLQHGKTATGFEVPEDVLAALGGGVRHAVTVTINGFTYRSTTARMGGQVLLPLAAENRAGAGVAAGDEITVTLEPDTAPREVEVPDDLAAALAADPAAQRAWTAASYTVRKEHARSLTEAKKPETRARRLERILAELGA